MCVCVCVVVNCGVPRAPANGKKWCSSTILGSYVKYKCNEGYRLVGYQYRQCISTGVWSGHLPTCERKLHYTAIYMYTLTDTFHHHLLKAAWASNKCLVMVCRVFVCLGYWVTGLLFYS